MISAPTRAPENLSLDRIKGFRFAGCSAIAGVGADIIRPRSINLNQKAIKERKYLFQTTPFQEKLTFVNDARGFYNDGMMTTVR